MFRISEYEFLLLLYPPYNSPNTNAFVEELKIISELTTSKITVKLYVLIFNCYIFIFRFAISTMIH